MIYGDVNKDGIVDMNDYAVVDENLSNGTILTYVQKVTADVDGDGSITLNDRDLIKQYTYNENIVFPVMN
jgi:hypothetical protein